MAGCWISRIRWWRRWLNRLISFNFKLRSEKYKAKKQRNDAFHTIQLKKKIVKVMYHRNMDRCIKWLNEHIYAYKEYVRAHKTQQINKKIYYLLLKWKATLYIGEYISWLKLEKRLKHQYRRCRRKMVLVIFEAHQSNIQTSIYLVFCSTFCRKISIVLFISFYVLLFWVRLKFRWAKEF